MADEKDKFEQWAVWNREHGDWRKVGEQPGPQDWKKQLHKEKKRFLNNVHNAVVCLSEADELAGVLSYDEMQCAPLIHALPGQGGFEPRPITDADMIELQLAIQRLGVYNITRNNVEAAVEKISREKTFHPVRDYLESLEWDGTPRLYRWPIDYLGTSHYSEYVRQIGEMFLISAVARIYKPGCKVDHMIVMEGAQGTLKSSACGILGGDWFSDSMPDITHAKEASQHLRGKWIIEISEMNALSRAENSALKAFISRKVEQYRPSYGRKEVSEPRQCVFVGSTNNPTYLKDETGGRRFWPLPTGRVNVNLLRHDRDQLFAEAVMMFKSGSAWWPDRDFEKDYIQPEQARRFEVDEWQQPIATFLKGLKSVTIYDIAKQCLSFEASRIGTADSRRIRSILVNLRWINQGQNRNGRVIWRSPEDNGETYQEDDEDSETLL